jgi:hypothetical protein
VIEPAFAQGRQHELPRKFAFEINRTLVQIRWLGTLAIFSFPVQYGSVFGHQFQTATRLGRERKMRRAIIITFLLLASVLVVSLPAQQASVISLSPEALGNLAPLIGGASLQGLQCPIVIPDSDVIVAPNQPEVQPRSTVGIINALCDVTLDFVGCGFTPTAITITCDTNGDGVPELMIPLKNITVVNRLLVQATLPALSPQLPGSPFPLTCCGGKASLIFTRHIGEGDDNIFGPFTQTLTCEIDLGVRAPVVISASPAEGDCALPQNLLIPGSCYILPDGKPNVTSVFAVDRVNPATVIQATKFVILNTNLIDAHFDFGAASGGKSFLIFASGPNGTSRNLTSLPLGAQSGCPLGNEQGVTVTFTCRIRPVGGESPVPAEFALINTCKIDRDPSGAFTLTLTGVDFKEGATLTIGGLTPKKLKFKDPVAGTNTFTRIVAKGRLCKGLPGAIVYQGPISRSSPPFSCNARCSN